MQNLKIVGGIVRFYGKPESFHCLNQTVFYVNINNVLFVGQRGKIQSECAFAQQKQVIVGEPSATGNQHRWVWLRLSPTYTLPPSGMIFPFFCYLFVMFLQKTAHYF